jgi:hypothetical protein
MACAAYLVLPKHRRNNLVHLDQRQWLAQTNTIPTSKHHIRLPELLHPGVIRILAFVLALQPPLRQELIRLRPKNTLLVVNNPRIHTHNRARRQHIAARQREPTVRHDAFEDVADDRVHAQALFDAGVEVGELFNGGVGCGKSEICGAQLGDEFGFCGGGFEQVVEDAFDDDGEGVGAAEDLGLC